MPCIFLKNVPQQYSPYPKIEQKAAFNGSMVRRLRAQIANAASCDCKGVEIHLSFQDYGILDDSGKVVPCENIHVFVLWFGKEERNEAVIQSISDALQHFLNVHGLGLDLDISYFDMPAGSFFVEDDGVSVMVKGGEVLPPFIQIANAVEELTGFNRDE